MELEQILDGNVTKENLLMLDDNWMNEERCNKALNCWQLSELVLEQKMRKLSGGTLIVVSHDECFLS